MIIIFGDNPFEFERKNLLKKSRNFFLNRLLHQAKYRNRKCMNNFRRISVLRKYSDDLRLIFGLSVSHAIQIRITVICPNSTTLRKIQFDAILSWFCWFYWLCLVWKFVITHFARRYLVHWIISYFTNFEYANKL